MNKDHYPPSNPPQYDGYHNRGPGYQQNGPPPHDMHHRRADFQQHDGRGKFLSPNQCIDRLLTSVSSSSSVARAMEGPNCRYFIVHAESPSDIAYSADFGLWPLRDPDIIKEISTMPETESVSTVFIVLCPSIAKYVGYFYVVGPSQPISEVDTEDIEMPKSWQTVCKAAWIRVAPLSLVSLRTQPQYLPPNIDMDTLLQNKDGEKITALMGENLCSLIDKLSTIRSMSQRDRSVTQSGRALYTLSSSNPERQNRQPMPY